MTLNQMAEDSLLISEKITSAEVKRLAQVYRGAGDNILARLAKTLKSNNPAEAFYEDRRSGALLEDIDAILAELQTETATGISKTLESSLQGAHARQAFLLQNFSVYPVRVIDPSTVRYYIDNIGAGVAKAKGLDNMLNLNTRLTKRKIENAIVSGVTSGQGFDKIGRELKRIIGTSQGGRFTGTLAEAVTIARTEGHRLHEVGAIRAQEEAEANGVVTEKIWTATLDGGTRPAHADADGQRRRQGEKFRVGGEELEAPGIGGSARNVINCRCTVIVVQAGKSPKVRTSRDPETGKSVAIDWQNYSSWAKKNGLV